jgi:thiol-disulfide isomerase/thioredoxin
MHKFLLGILLIFMVTANSFGGSARTYGDALAAAKSDGKHLMVVFTAEWCGPCRSYKGSTLSDKEVLQELEDNFHYYLMDTDEEKALAKKFRISSLPTTKIIDKNEKVVDTKVGIVSKRDMLKWLENNRQK